MNIQHYPKIVQSIDRLKSYGHAVSDWFIKILFAQLFLTTFSLPILLWWGLPLSGLTVIGNIIFNPCIGLFLFFSTLLFFCELVYLPSWPLVFALEKLSDVWLWLVAQGSRHALIALPRPGTFVLLAIAAISLCIMYHFCHRQKQGIVWFLAFLLTLGCCLRWFLVPQTTAVALPYGSRALWVVSEGKRSFLFDAQGVLRPGNQTRSWADFTLRPYLVTTLGRVTCDAIVVMQPTAVRLQAAVELAYKIKATYVVVPAEKFNKKMFDGAHPGVSFVLLPEREIIACTHHFIDADGVLKNDATSCVSLKKLWYTIKNFRWIKK